MNSLTEVRIKPGLPRVLEILLAGIGLVVIAPVIGAAALAIAVTSSGPVFFRQRRIGRKGQTFVLWKMRTMRHGNPGLQVTAGDDSRVTGAGKWLRKAKIDELPELWNVLKGEMSLVGPRPEVPAYVDLNRLEWQLALEARPGITDPMTLRLRNEETLLSQISGDREEFYLTVLQPYKLRGYIDYLSRRSWLEDSKILVRTLVAIILPHATPPPSVDELLLFKPVGKFRTEPRRGEIM